MNINEHIIRLTGNATIPSGLDMNKTYTIKADGEITKTEDKNNQDGTINRVFTFKPVVIEAIDERGEAIKSKDTRSMSKKLRAVIWREWSDSDTGMSDEQWYEKRMGEIMGALIEGKI